MWRFPHVATKRVFPAHAGMSPVADAKAYIAARFPRSRGDEPAAAALTWADLSFSPLTRG